MMVRSFCPSAAVFVATFLVFILAETAFAQVDARMLRHPDVSETHITFVYAGDVWVVPKIGGTAHRLSSPEGEETFPRFSPDGQYIAFSGNYGGHTDIYKIPAMGGNVTRLTHHPMNDRMLGWYPDGESILYSSSKHSEQQRYNQFYRVTAEGGLPEKLPVPYGEFGALSPDGRTLAYTPIDRSFRTWKRYQGGMAPDIWLFDLETFESENITNNESNDALPMWHNDTVYFLSDRGPYQRANIWAYERGNGELRQVTSFEAFDVHFPSIGPSDMVFEAGGQLYLMDLETEAYEPVAIRVVTDRATLKPRTENVSGLIQNAWISPGGARVVFEARGDLFTVPAEHGAIRTLTHDSGAAKRFPAWSPDGQWVAAFSDASGEYELTVIPANGQGEPRTLSSLGEGFRYQPYWSPDSRKIAFIDQSMRIQIYDFDSEEVTEVDRARFMFHGALNNFRVSWSPDSRWLAYHRDLDNRGNAIFLYDTEAGERHQVTSGYYNDRTPVFDPDGQYLYALSSRNIAPEYSDLDNSFIYPNTTHIVAITLREELPSPLAPRNDEEPVEEEDEEADDEEEEEIERVEIDLEDFERRLVVLPPDAGNYADLQAASGKVLYRRLPRTGSGTSESPVVYFDLEEREEKTVLGDAHMMMLAAGGEKLLVRHEDRYAVLDVQPDQQIEDPLPTGRFEKTVEPVAEWRQLFNDTWRFQRDFFYDPNMHGVDWEAMGEQYGALLDDAVTRWDVNYVIGELISELNASHTYRGGGDLESAEQRNAGMLGVDWSLENGAFRIERIVRGAPWDSEVRSPFDVPGVEVQEGDYVLAVNGRPLDTNRAPWAAFEGLAGETVALTVNDEPTMDGAREVIVELLSSETRLRHLEWIEANRQRVDEATDGRVGYIYVPDTGIGGQNELVRQFNAQFHKDGLIIDERFNSGGQIPDRFIELLNRPPIAFWGVRDGEDWQWPPVAHFGPKVMLINGWSGSGGDAFPDYFRQAELGPLVGTRTWGGLIGITGMPTLVDGGSVTSPTFRMYYEDGTWFPEGHGVEPDIEVVDDATRLARGEDPQLERAIEEVLHLMEEQPPLRPERPPYEDRRAPAHQ